MARLWPETDPDDVATIRDRDDAIYHASRPWAGPVSTSPWRLSSVTLANSSSSVILGSVIGATTSFPSATVTSTSPSGFSRASSANDFGICTARLLPHRRILVSMPLLKVWMYPQRRHGVAVTRIAHALG